jgi:curved DNA-binding protein CbpA
MEGHLPMAKERRNLYRLLHVQPEAPPEIIKASYRTLMSALRAHPDLGGDAERAAQLNAAYAVLSNPARRRAYDETLRVKPAPKPVAFDPADWQAAGRCPLCRAAFQSRPTGARCLACDSPLAAAPNGSGGAAELLGRRGGPRFERDQTVLLHRPGAAAQRARLRDLSLSGLSLVCAEPVAQGTTLRVVAPAFDAVVLVVSSNISNGICQVHARLLTLQLAQAARGVFVAAKV